MLDLTGHGLGLGNLFRLETVAFEHVAKVHVSAHVELVGAIQCQPSVLEEPGEHAMHNRRSDLAFDVIADDRNPGIAKSSCPGWIGGNEDGDRVYEGHTSFDCSGRVCALSHLGSDGKVTDEDIGSAVL